MYLFDYIYIKQLDQKLLDCPAYERIICRQAELIFTHQFSSGDLNIAQIHPCIRVANVAIYASSHTLFNCWNPKWRFKCWRQYLEQRDFKTEERKFSALRNIIYFRPRKTTIPNFNNRLLRCASGSSWVPICSIEPHVRVPTSQISKPMHTYTRTMEKASLPSDFSKTDEVKPEPLSLWKIGWLRILGRYVNRTHSGYKKIYVLRP